MTAKIPIACAVIMLFVTVTAQAALDLNIYDDTVIQPGDDFNIVNIYDDATVGMTGGNVDRLYIKGSGTVNLFDGLIGSLYVSDTASLLMYGGELTNALRLRSSGVGKLFGGNIAPEISIHESGVTVFHGYNFAWEQSGSGTSGFLSGYLVDDTQFTTYLRGLPEAFPGSHVVLVPEPATSLFIVAGSLVTTRLSRNRRATHTDALA